MAKMAQGGLKCSLDILNSADTSINNSEGTNELVLCLQLGHVRDSHERDNWDSHERSNPVRHVASHRLPQHQDGSGCSHSGRKGFVHAACERLSNAPSTGDNGDMHGTSKCPKPGGPLGKIPQFRTLLFALHASAPSTIVIIMISPLALHNVRCSLQTGSLHVIAVEEVQLTVLARDT
mgnify:CR=1 FL=1